MFKELTRIRNKEIILFPLTQPSPFGEGFLKDYPTI